MNGIRQSILERSAVVQAAAAEPADGLWQRVALLRREDRLMVELALRSGRSHRQIAELLRRTPGTVSRALRRLSRRLHDPLVLALLHPDCPLDGETRQIGVEHFLVGLSGVELAQKHDLPAAEVRRSFAFIRLWYRGLAARRNDRLIEQ
jgi:DNA-directed RNA polymerase specialized sigma24 family protein